DGIRAFHVTGVQTCALPICVENCPAGAMYKREEDGVVIADSDKCIGCRYCEWACPYGAPQFNPETGVIAKCDFCVDEQAAGEDRSEERRVGEECRARGWWLG